MDKDRWEYNASITVRLEAAVKDKLAEEARARGISISEFARIKLTQAKLPDELLSTLSPEYQKAIERLAQSDKVDTGVYLTERLIPQAVVHFIKAYLPRFLK